ncbi:MAG: hypothetical protein U0T82_16470 [Bacteroidales bacterium]
MKRILLIITILLPCFLLQGQATITRGEYFFDTDPGFGNGTGFTIASPGSDLNLPFSIPVGALQPGLHKLNYRFKDAAGHWGLTAGKIILVIPEAQPLSQITKVEYFADADPGFGNGVPLTISSPSSDLSFTVQIPGSQFTSGMHGLGFRFRDASGKWSLSAGRLIFTEAYVPPSQIVYGEYFSSPDPGIGNGTPFIVSPNVNLNTSLNISASWLPDGIQSVQFRFRDEKGKWSHTAGRQLFVEEPGTLLEVVKGEYFIDKEPGIGKGVAFNLSDPAQDATVIRSLPASGMTANSFHNLYFRFQDKDGKWGLTNTRPVYISDGKEKYFTPISKVEYHVDQGTGQSKLRTDSVGLVMHGRTLFSVQPILPVDTLDIGRHFISVRGIDLFNNFSPVYDNRKFVVTNDTTKGMLLGITLTPDSVPMTSGSVDVYEENAGTLAFKRNIPLTSDGIFFLKDLLRGIICYCLNQTYKHSPPIPIMIWHLSGR